jgi:hypothetical protein
LPWASADPPGSSSPSRSTSRRHSPRREARRSQRQETSKPSRPAEQRAGGGSLRPAARGHAVFSITPSCRSLPPTASPVDEVREGVTLDPTRAVSARTSPRGLPRSSARSSPRRSRRLATRGRPRTRRRGGRGAAADPAVTWTISAQRPRRIRGPRRRGASTRTCEARRRWKGCAAAPPGRRERARHGPGSLDHAVIRIADGRKDDGRKSSAEFDQTIESDAREAEWRPHAGWATAT